MGIKYVKLLWIRVGDDWRARACRDCPPYILKEVCDDLYGADNWCIAWDLAYDRQALDDAKTNVATAIKGARMVFNPLVKKGITVVACLEGQNCGDYYDGRFPKRGYRAKGGKRQAVQFRHEEAVLKVLTRKGLEVSPAAGCCGELNAARLIGTDFETEIHGAKLCVLGKSADSDALVVMRQVLTVDGDEGDWCVYDRQAVLDAYGVEFDALAFFCALSDEFGSSTGRTGHGACALDCLLCEFDGFQNREGDFTVEQVMAALKFVADLDDDVFPGEAETVAARFRAFVEDDVSLPAAAAGDKDAHAVAAAIIAFLSSPQRMTTDGTRAKHREVLKEMWHFADYLCQEVESHASLDPPLKFPEKRWAANARA